MNRFVLFDKYEVCLSLLREDEWICILCQDSLFIWCDSSVLFDQDLRYSCV